jgi:flagellar assembly protein FliH
LSKSILKEPPVVRPWHPISTPTPTTWRPTPAGGDRTAGGDVSVPSLRALFGRPGESAAPEAVLQWAREERERILQQAYQEAEQIRADAVKEGFQAGQASACEEVAAERRGLADLLDQMDTAYREFCADQVPALADVATEAAARLMHEQLAVEPQRVLTVVGQALEHLVASSRITMHLHPEDMERVRDFLASRDSRQTPGIQLVADPAVERGGCWLETEQGEVDATVGGRISRLANALDEVG